MKKTFATALVLTLAAAGTVLAQEARPARVTIVDMARVSAESPLGKSYVAQLDKLQTEIQAAMTQKQTELGKLDAAIKALQDELETQGSVLSQEAREKKQLEITRKSRERQAFLEDGQAEINRMREHANQEAQRITNEFQLKVRPIIEQVAKEKGFDVIIDSQFAYTVNRDFDITALVITRAEAVPAAAAAPAAPAPAAKPAAKPAAPKP